MIREEEIAKAADEAFKTTDFYIPTFEILGFTLGANWADENPKSPWISVDEDLPYNHEELIAADGRYEKNTICVITINKYGIIEGNYMVLYDDGKWEWKYGVPAPCYWMLIPKLPKESEIELTVY